MVQEVIKQWDENKKKLEEYFRTTRKGEYSGSYKSILQKVVELVVTQYDATRITVVDDGDRQGTQLFLIPTNKYQPSIKDYVITHTYYGSCSDCDTLEAIWCHKDGLPTEEQVKKYMTLALHLVQKMKRIADTD